MRLPKTLIPDIATLTRLQGQLLEMVYQTAHDLWESDRDMDEDDSMQVASSRRGCPKTELTEPTLVELLSPTFGSESRHDIYDRMFQTPLAMEDLINNIVGSAICVWVLDEK